MAKAATQDRARPEKARAERPKGAAVKAVDQSGKSGSTLMVLAVAIVLVGTALFFLMIGRERAYPYVIGLLAVLSVIGVFSLFAYAAGIVRFASEEGRNDLTKAIADGEPEASVVTEPSGRVLYANPAYLRLTGATGPDDVRGVERAFTGDPQWAEAIYRLAQAAREGRRHQEEVRRPQADGAIWFRMTVRPLVSGDVDVPRGGVGASVWTVVDISRDRLNAESAFENLQKTINFLDHAPAGFFSVEADGAITYMNATLAGWLDHDLAEVGSGGLTLSGLLAADGAALLQTLAPAPGEVRVHTFDLDLRKKNGLTLPARLIHKVAYGADGAAGASRTLVINRAREGDEGDSLRAAEVRFARFFNSSPLGIATIDPAGMIKRENPLFAKLMAHVPGSRSILDLVTGSPREALSAAIRAAGEGQGDIAPVEGAVAGPGNRMMKFFLSPVDDAEASGETAIVYAVETTEARLLQEQVTQSQKLTAIGQLAGGVAHDFNNVLQAISGHADLLLLSHKPADPAFNDIMQIRQNSYRAASLVRQLLAFSRKQTLRPEVVQISDVLTDASMLLRRTLGENVALDMAHGRDLWPVKADVTQLEQVVLNLAVNARDAMPEGGKLSIRTQNVPAAERMRYAMKDQPIDMPDADTVMIEVADTGTGIPPDVITKIFEPFFSTKEIGKGTGLGLSTVYGIVKQSGGHIFVESKVGRGTAFRIFLPRHIPEAEVADPASPAPVAVPDVAAKPTPAFQPVPTLAPSVVPSADAVATWAAAAKASPDTPPDPPIPETPAPEPVARSGPGTILLVDDEDAVRAFGARALSSRGYTVLEAASGVEALEVMQEAGGKVDLVVSDVLMPEMNGPQLIKELARTMPGLRVVFVSGYADDAFKDELPPGVNYAFLPKPFGLKDLIEAVQKQLPR